MPFDNSPLPLGGKVMREFNLKKIFILLLFVNSIYPFRPDEGAFEFRASIGPAYHTSDISKAEEEFSDYFGFKFIIIDSTSGEKDTIDLNYSFTDVEIEGAVLYYLIEGFGIGLSYQYGWLHQTIDTKKNIHEPSEKLFKNHKIGPQLRLWSMGNIISFLNASVSLGVNFNWGKLNRFAVLEENYKNDDEIKNLIAQANKTLKSLGFGISPRFSLYLFAGEHLSVFVTGRYDFIVYRIDSDVLINYPQRSVSHEIGALIGINFLTFSR